MFYPVLYLRITELADAEEYAGLVDDIKKWQSQMSENHKTMKQMLKKHGGLEGEMFKDIFTIWNKHQDTLVSQCNALLQFHIKFQNQKAGDQ